MFPNHLNPTSGFQTNQPNQTHPSNHVRIQVSHDREHGWYIRFFTLQRLYNFPTSRDFITCKQMTKVSMLQCRPSTIHTPVVCCQEITTKPLQRILPVCVTNTPGFTARYYHLEAPSCAMWFLRITFPHPRLPSGPHNTGRTLINRLSLPISVSCLYGASRVVAPWTGPYLGYLSKH